LKYCGEADGKEAQLDTNLALHDSPTSGGNGLKGEGNKSAEIPTGEQQAENQKGTNRVGSGRDCMVLSMIQVENATRGRNERAERRKLNTKKQRDT